jgi:hypothetical protein
MGFSWAGYAPRYFPHSLSKKKEKKEKKEFKRAFAPARNETKREKFAPARQESIQIRAHVQQIRRAHI